MLKRLTFIKHNLSDGNGFTLVELMIVVTIIAILTVIGIVNYSSFTRSSRDAKRLSDLKMIQSALESYHADQIYYPYQVTPGQQLVFVPKTYLTEVPNDPKENPDYSYSPLPSGCDNTTTKCTSYCLYAQMEDKVPISDTDCTLVPLGFTAEKTYGVTRP